MLGPMLGLTVQHAYPLAGNFLSPVNHGVFGRAARALLAW